MDHALGVVKRLKATIVGMLQFSISDKNQPLSLATTFSFQPQSNFQTS
jgi:hypothetical protein